MKKLIKYDRIIKKYIDIIVDIDDYIQSENIAATNTEAKTFQPSIKKSLKISDEALVIYTDFLNSVLRVITSKELEIVRHYQSKRSYTYYIEVEHYGTLGEDVIKYEITFRISEHINRTLVKTTKPDSENQIVVPVIKNYQIGKFTSSVYTQVMIHLNKICIGIANDNESALQSEYAIFTEEISG